MEIKTEDIKYGEYLLESLYDIGYTDRGGVTRLGYTAVEDEMHEKFIELATELGYGHTADEVGNTFVGAMDDTREFTLIGSHLDSVVDGGRYDGVAGVLAGLMVLRWAKQDGIDLPLRVVGFRCEESSNFGQCTVGSGLVTNSLDGQQIGNLTALDGKLFKDIFEERGYTLTPPVISGVKEYLELHIEQGKVLEELGHQIGVVTDIAGPSRHKVFLQGVADHSGATPMTMRQDALCGAAEIILAVEELGLSETGNSSVATIGVLNNAPNVLNVIPDRVELGIDIRGIDEASINRVVDQMKAKIKEVCKRRNLTYSRQEIGSHAPVKMNTKMQAHLVDACEKLALSYCSMASGAGHDAMNFLPICPNTAMIFIPCYKGISHNKREFVAVDSIVEGARVLYEYLKGATK